MPSFSAVQLLVGRLILRSERLELVRSIADVVTVTVSLQRHGAARLLRPSDSPFPTAVDAADAMSVAERLDCVFAAMPFAPTCLRRSLALRRTLQRQGIEAPLTIGVRRGHAGIEAHAWVEVDGVPVNDDPDAVSSYSIISSGDFENVLLSLQ